jgi:hypothetical protein
MQFTSAKMAADGVQGREDWFEQRRDFFIRQVFDDFFLMISSFQELYGIYLTCRQPGAQACADLLDRQNMKLRVQIWDRLTAMVGTEVDRGPLWRLKDLCHRLWPEGEQPCNFEGSLFDWLIGSIFHEAMKLKENIYILNSYGPAAFKFSELEPSQGAGPLQRDISVPRLARMMDINGLIKRIVGDVISQMEQLAFLFGQAVYMLRTLVSCLSQNMLLIRFLVEQEDTVCTLWGEGMDDVFADMFYDAPEQGFCAAGRSYLNGQWYSRAFAMYQRARDIAPGCDEAVAKVYQLQTIIRRNKELFGEG